MNNNEQHVILGNGPLGLAVARELVKRKKRVRMVNRSGKANGMPQGIELVTADLYNVDEVKRVTAGASVVYQIAQPAYHEWQQKFPPLQASIIEGVAASGAKLIIGENLYMYGDTNGKPITEDLPYTAHTRKGKTRAEMAQAALAAHRAGKVRVAIGRGSDFFGPFVVDSLYGERMIAPTLKGKAAEGAGNLNLPHTATFIDDFGKALVILGERDEALGQAWHVPNDRPTLTQREFIEIIFQELGQPTKMNAIGKTMMSIAGLFVPGARETVEMMYEFEKPFVVDGTKFERAFGMKATPIRESIRQTVAWYKSHTEKR